MSSTMTFADVYTGVQHFYANQALLLDGGLHDPVLLRRWAETFTEDGTFWINLFPVPVQGREAIVQAITRITGHVRAGRIVRRHWFCALDIVLISPETVRTHYYALVFATAPGGVPVIDACTVVDDVLARTVSGFRTLSRQIRRDDISPELCPQR
jgi:SnoaL-like domain